SGIDLGFMTKSRLNHLLGSGDISDKDRKIFLVGARAFFVRSFEYAVRNMPVDDQLLKKAAFVQFEERQRVSIAMVQYFVERYSQLLSFTSAVDMDALTQEMHDYQMMDDQELPTSDAAADGQSRADLSYGIKWA
ncbi:predicted protein, partial [Nematostella vectensis]